MVVRFDCRIQAQGPTLHRYDTGELYAIGRLSEPAYERLTSAAYRVTDTGQLVGLVNAISKKAYPQEAPHRRARSGGPSPETPDEIDRIASDFYQAISWQCDHAPSLEALLGLIDPAAHFFQGGDSMDVGAFWQHRVDLWARRTALPFFQRETSARTLRFGDLVHRFSCYVAWDEQRDEPLPELCEPAA